MNLIMGDCLEKMRNIPDGSVDLIICDPPYGVSKCAWDSVLNLNLLWDQYKRILKPFGTCVIFGTEPFMAQVISSNFEDYAYQWYWEKNNKTGALLAHWQPMRCIEEMAVFICNAKGNAGQHEALRDYMQREKEASGLTRKQIDELLGNSMSSHYFTNGEQFALPSQKDYEALQATGRFQRPLEDLKKEWKSESGQYKPTYNPQGVVDLTKPRYKKESGSGHNVYANVSAKTHKQTKTGYPCNILRIQREKNIVHPTQKPIELLRYLIRTYTNRGGIVLDNCMGSGSTGVAAVIEDREFIGIELDEKYFNIAKERIEQAQKETF